MVACLPYLDVVLLKGKWLGGLYSGYSPADASGSSDDILQGRNKSNVSPTVSFIHPFPVLFPNFKRIWYR